MADDTKDRTIKSPTDQYQSSNSGTPPVGQTPLDPNDNAQGMMNDTTGLTGISKDTNNPSTPTNDTGDVARTMSDFQSKASKSPPVDKGQFVGNSVPPTQATPGSTPVGNDELSNPAVSPDEVGEQSVSGDMPDPASDDDTLANAQNVGLRLDEDEEHPKPLDIGSDRDKAEEYHRSH